MIPLGNGYTICRRCNCQYHPYARFDECPHEFRPTYLLERKRLEQTDNADSDGVLKPSTKKLIEQRLDEVRSGSTMSTEDLKKRLFNKDGERK